MQSSFYGRPEMRCKTCDGDAIISNGDGIIRQCPQCKGEGYV